MLLGYWGSIRGADRFFGLAVTALYPGPAAADDAMDARHLTEEAQFTLETFSPGRPRWRRSGIS